MLVLCCSHYSWLADLMIGAPTTSLQVQQVGGLNERRRAQATPRIIQTFLKGCLGLGGEANGKPPPWVVGRSTSSRAFEGPFPNFLVNFLNLLIPYLTTCYLLGGLAMCALHHAGLTCVGGALPMLWTIFTLMMHLPTMPLWVMVH